MGELDVENIKKSGILVVFSQLICDSLIDFFVKIDFSLFLMISSNVL